MKEMSKPNKQCNGSNLAGFCLIFVCEQLIQKCNAVLHNPYPYK